MSKSAPTPELGPCPPRFTEIKHDIAESYPNFQERVTQAWNEILQELKSAVADFARQGSEVGHLYIYFRMQYIYCSLSLIGCPSSRIF